MTHPNATPGKAIYLDEFIYEEGTPIGKCYQCHLPNPFTNNQVLTEGVDYVKQRQIRALGLTEWNNCTQKEYETTYSFPQERRIIAIPLQASDKPVANPHECPECNWQCTCTDQPCSCCNVTLPLQAERREGEKVLGEWQLCPKCLGEGFVPGKGVSVHDVCDVCNGAKILAKPLITNKG